MNAFGKIISILLGVLLLFIMPVLYLAQKQDTMNQNFVMTETVKFVDSIKNSGYLTNDMFKVYQRKLHVTQNVYTIELVHTYTEIDPEFSETEVTGIRENDYEIYNNTILGTLEKEGIYYMNQGDYISVKVYNRNKTFASKILQTFIQSEVPTVQVYVTYGGIIRDENY